MKSVISGLFFIFALTLNLFSQPLLGYRICIDPGHGGHDPSNDREIFLPYGIIFWESEGNLKTALNLDSILQELGATVKLTRTTNNDADDISLSERSQIANDFGADYFHSIHTNGYDGTLNYSLVLYKGEDNAPAWTKAKEMAEIMSPNLMKLLRTTAYYSRGDYSFLGFNLGVLKNSNMPATLSEGAFHDYIESGLRLKSLYFSKNYAWAIAKSFMKYFGTSGFSKGRVGGVLFDATTKKPLNNAKVVANPGNITCITDYNYNGFYAMDLVPGNYTLTISKKNYVSKDVKITISANEYTETDINLYLSNNGYPVADFYTRGLPAGSNQTVYFIAKNSYDTDGTITTYDWNFGDGTTAQGDSVSHTFDADGNYNITLIVTDNNNQKDSLTKIISILTQAPQLPVLYAVIPNNSIQTTLKWQKQEGCSYRLFMSQSDNLNDFTLIADETELATGTNEYTISNLTAGNEGYNFYIKAVNSAGTSDSSDIYSCYMPNDNNAQKLLIVDGFDRMSSWQNPCHSFAHTYMAAWRKVGNYRISSAANEAVATGQVKLNDYDIVMWFLGDESTADQTFSSTEQSLVKNFLENGGKLIVSGSEIAWDLVKKGSSNDQYFYHNYLKADFSADGIENNNPASGKNRTVFSGISLNFGQVYPEDYPDELSTYGKSEPILTYKNGQIAGVAYKGFFGSSNDTAAVFNIAFPLETVDDFNALTSFFSAVFQYYNQTGITQIENWENYLKIYPVPAKSTINIEYNGKSLLNGFVELTDLSGKIIINKPLTNYSRGTSINIKQLSPGIYILKLNAKGTTYSKKIIKN